MSGEYINFVNEDRDFTCLGFNVRWFLPNRTQVFHGNLKYEIETISNSTSKLTIHNVNALDTGDYYCVAEDVDKTFRLHLYCKYLIEN